jgi:type I restriction enzyme, R subunit
VKKLQLTILQKFKCLTYAERPEWKGSIEASKDFIWSNGLRFLRHYQLKAIVALQKAVAKEKTDFFLKWQQEQEKH